MRAEAYLSWSARPGFPGGWLPANASYVASTLLVSRHPSETCGTRRLILCGGDGDERVEWCRRRAAGRRDWLNSRAWRASSDLFLREWTRPVQCLLGASIPRRTWRMPKWQHRQNDVAPVSFEASCVQPDDDAMRERHLYCGGWCRSMGRLGWSSCFVHGGYERSCVSARGWAEYSVLRRWRDRKCVAEFWSRCWRGDQICDRFVRSDC